MNIRKWIASAVITNLIYVAAVYPVQADDTDPERILFRELKAKSDRYSEIRIHAEGTVIEFERRPMVNIPGFVGIKEYYRVVNDVTFTLPSGEEERLVVLQPVPQDEVIRQQVEEDTEMSAEALQRFGRVYGGASILFGAAVQAEISDKSPFNGVVGSATLWNEVANENRTFDLLEYTGCHRNMMPWGDDDEPSDTSTARTVGARISLATNPLSLMMGQACVLMQAPDFLGEEEEDKSEFLEQLEQTRKDFANFAEYQEIASIDGDLAHHIRADNIGHEIRIEDDTSGALREGQPANRWWERFSLIPSAHAAAADSKVGSGISSGQSSSGQTAIINSIDAWIEVEHMVRLKTRIEGTLTQEGEQRDFFIEKQLSDYRDVPGSSLYEPYRETLRMGGILGPDEQAEMEEAKVELEKLDRHMAEMPASQRSMMENMMGEQIEQWRSLVNGGAIEVDVITTNININAAGFGSKDQFNPGGASTSSRQIGDEESAAAQTTPPAEQAQDPEALRAAQEQCLQEKIAAAQSANKKKRGIGKFIGVIARTTSRLGNRDISRAVGDVYRVNADASDLASAAEDLGLTEDEVQACQNSN